MRRILVPFLAAVGLLTVFLAVLGPSRLAAQLAGVDVLLFALGPLAVLLALFCWSEATRYLFASAGVGLPRRRAFLAYGTGAFGKQVLPMGNAGGPAVMAYAFDREADLGYSRSLAVVAVAEFLSLAASLVLAVAGVAVLVSFGAPARQVRWLGVGVLVAAAALVALVLVVWYRRAAVAAALAVVTRLLQPVAGRVSSDLAERLAPERVDAGLSRYYEGVDAAVADRRAVAAAFVVTQLGWVFFAAPLYTSALALDVRLPVALVLFLVPAAGLATVVPLPGGLGGLEIALAGLLAALTVVDLAAAGAVVVLYRLCSFWFFVLVGGVSASVAAGGLGETPEVLDAPTVALGDGPAPPTPDSENVE